MTPNIMALSPMAFCDWARPFVEGSLFAVRERMVILLAQGAGREKLEMEFREFFEEYCGLAFLFEPSEKSLLVTLDECAAFSHLKCRVTDVETHRKTSPAGRIARRTGGGILGAPSPEIKVSALSDADFRALIETLVNWPLFAARKRVVKLLDTVSELGENTGLPASPQFPSTFVEARGQSAFLEFFVCYLELEQFLEDYDYDADEHLALRPEVAERLERSAAAVEAGTAELTPLAEVAKELGIELQLRKPKNKCLFRSART